LLAARVQFSDSRPCGGLQGAPRNSHIQTSKSVRVKSRCIFSKAFRYFLLHLKAHYFVFLLNPKHIQSSGRGDNACTHAVALCLIDAEKDHIQLSISRGQTLCKLCVNGRKCSTRVFLCRTHAHAYMELYSLHLGCAGSLFSEDALMDALKICLWSRLRQAPGADSTPSRQVDATDLVCIISGRFFQFL
jgi:hypothetical protein